MIHEKNITLYDYLLPIISEEKRFLISNEKLHELAESKSLSSLISNLIKFYPKMADIFKKVNLEMIHFLLHEDFIEKTYKIIQNSPHNTRSFLMTFLFEFEIENLVTIFRSRKIHKNIEDISERVHWQVEEYTKNKEIFEKILKLNDFYAIFNLLKPTIYGEFIKKAEKRYKERNFLLYVNTFLDYGQIVLMRRSLDSLSKIDKEIASAYYTLLTEYYNFMILFRGKSLNLKNEEILEFFIPDTQPKITQILKELLPIEIISNLIDLIKNKKFGVKSSFLNFPEKTKSYFEILNYLDRNFYENCLKFALKIRIKYPFSLSTPLSFILLKKFQFKDLIQISTGIDYKLPKDVIIQRTILLP